MRFRILLNKHGKADIGSASRDTWQKKSSMQNLEKAEELLANS